MRVVLEELEVVLTYTPYAAMSFGKFKLRTAGSTIRILPSWEIADFLAATRRLTRD